MASIPQHSTVSMTDAGTDALATIGGRHAMLDGKPQGGCTIDQFPLTNADRPFMLTGLKNRYTFLLFRNSSVFILAFQACHRCKNRRLEE